MQTSDKSSYVKPVINRIGSFEDITLGGQFSGLTDAIYPVGTPSTTPTFS
jgi:hypothetical protein